MQAPRYTSPSTTSPNVATKRYQYWPAPRAATFGSEPRSRALSSTRRRSSSRGWPQLVALSQLFMTCPAAATTAVAAVPAAAAGTRSRRRDAATHSSPSSTTTSGTVRPWVVSSAPPQLPQATAQPAAARSRDAATTAARVMAASRTRTGSSDSAQANCVVTTSGGYSAARNEAARARWAGTRKTLVSSTWSSGKTRPDSSALVAST